MKALQIRTLLSLASTLGLAAASPVLAQDSEAEADGFVSLLDGKSLEGWVLPEPIHLWGVNRKTGALERKARGGGYLWSAKDYGDFILELQFKVSPGCNSGVFLRTDPADPVQGGFEIQIMDSHGKGAEVGKHDAGAFYDAQAPASNAVKEAGHWNALRIEWIGPKLKVTINGQVVQDLDVDDWDTPGQNPDGSKNKFKKALKDQPRTGRIGFQDHGHDVAFRKIRIKEMQ